MYKYVKNNFTGLRHFACKICLLLGDKHVSGIRPVSLKYSTHAKIEGTRDESLV